MSESGDLSLEDALSYELSLRPPVPFGAQITPYRADKLHIIKANSDYAKHASSEPVIDIIPETD